jgi:hypothetical protein
VVHLCLAFAICSVETVLYFVEAIQEAEPGLDCPFDCRHEFLISVHSLLMEACDWDKGVQVFDPVKVTYCNAQRGFVVKSYIVHYCLQLKTLDLIKDKCLLWVLQQILLKCCMDLFEPDVFEWG